jgi:glycine cleavage system H protein
VPDYKLPEDLHYTTHDEWVRRDGDTLRIGVSDFAQEQLGDIVFVEFPEVGSAVTRDEPFGVIESVKAVSDLYAPVSGSVTAVNETLGDAPETVNEDPYGEGWLIEIAPSDPAELELLLDAASYTRSVAERSD